MLSINGLRFWYMTMQRIKRGSVLVYWNDHSIFLKFDMQQFIVSRPDLAQQSPRERAILLAYLRNGNVKCKKDVISKIMPRYRLVGTMREL